MIVYYLMNNTDESEEPVKDTNKYWSGTPFQNDNGNNKRDKFWKTTPHEYATMQTDGLDENKKVIAYPMAYLFRSIFTAKFWMFALVGLIIIISFKSIITNDLS